MKYPSLKEVSLVTLPTSLRPSMLQLVLVLSVVSVVVIVSIIVAILVFLRKYSRTRGDYYTQEGG